MRGKTLSLKKICDFKKNSEYIIEEVRFKIHKFSPRTKTHPKNTIIFPCFSEFGTEVLGTVYCIPKLMQRYRGKYSIAVGWQGRAFLYKNLVDEFWEIDESHQWLRKYCRAFHHNSINLAKIETKLKEFGNLINVFEMGNVLVYPKLNVCLICEGKVENQKCTKCNFEFPEIGLFDNPTKKNAVWPIVSEDKKKEMAKYIKPNSVGVVARNRETYGRNLPSDFYIRLIDLLQGLNYDPIWLGEKETILPCPKSITDFSITEDAKDLENTLALVSQLRFTIQFWTASTRLAGLTDIPYILFESPDQIIGGTITPGHEGSRLFLTTKSDKKKIVLAHYNSILNNQDYALELVKQAIKEVEINNFSDISGFVYDKEYWQ